MCNVFQVGVIRPAGVDSDPGYPLAVLLRAPCEEVNRSVQVGPFTMIFRATYANVRTVRSNFDPCPGAALIVFFRATCGVEEGKQFA